MKTITSRQHPFVSRCRAAGKRRDRADQDMLLDGIHLVRDALNAGVAIRGAAVTPASLQQAEIAAAWARLAVTPADLFVVSDAVMEAASPVRTPTGILAIALPRVSRIDDVFARQPALAVGIIGVQDPGNVGAIIRSAEAAGATGIAVADGSADPFGWKALRGAMGSAFRLPIATGALTAGSVAGAARSRGVRCIAAVLDGGMDVFACDLTQPSLILLGSEGGGLDAKTGAGADLRVRIPMAAGIESLNVAVAAGVILFEAYRQRAVRQPGHSS